MRQDAGLLYRELSAVRKLVAGEAERLTTKWRSQIRGTACETSAENLAAYLALRNRDLRELQARLVPLGVSSLGRCEAHVLATIDAVLATLAILSGTASKPAQIHPPGAVFGSGKAMIKRQASEVLGATAEKRRVRILVTLPTEAARDAGWMRKLLRVGADCVRVNCAHDSADDWLAMIRNVRRAERSVGRKCKVLMDLTGPRARTDQVRTPDPKRRIQVGDPVMLVRTPADFGKGAAFQAVCALPEIYEQLKPWASIWFNEGRIGTRVDKVKPKRLELTVTQARPEGEKFREDMGMNFPGADLRIAPLTAKDMEDLDFIVQHADMVGYSFVQEPEDMGLLLGELDARRAAFKRREKLGVIAKIGTARAVRNLPEIMVRAASRGPFAVMIARGYLAVEIGYLRIAEIQEEILWLCEAAHVPVIWATQVLESLAKKGMPSRAEITDAAMSERAECVMLNKGPYILDAVKILDLLLTRMAEHQRKKTPTLRRLRSWQHLLP